MLPRRSRPRSSLNFSGGSIKPEKPDEPASDSEAAEALQANADIKLTKLSKFLRKGGRKPKRRGKKDKRGVKRADTSLTRYPSSDDDIGALAPPAASAYYGEPSDAQQPAGDVEAVAANDEDDQDEDDDDRYDDDANAKGTINDPSVGLPESASKEQRERGSAVASPADSSHGGGGAGKHNIYERVGDITNKILQPFRPDFESRVKSNGHPPPAPPSTSDLGPSDRSNVDSGGPSSTDEERPLGGDRDPNTGSSQPGASSPRSKKSSRRRRKRREKRMKRKQRSYVKGNIIGKKHELYTTSIAMMLGLRHAVNGVVREGDDGVAVGIEEGKGRGGGTAVGVEATRMSRAPKTSLTKDDFSNTGEISFPPRGSSSTPPHNLSHTFRFKTYAGSCFASLRLLFGIRTEKFLNSICGNSNFIEFVSNAQSGQFFFYSHDGKYMIKTMTSSEARFLQSILPG